MCRAQLNEKDNGGATGADGEVAARVRQGQRRLGDSAMSGKPKSGCRCRVDNLSIDIWTGLQRRILPTTHSSDEVVARYENRSPHLQLVQEVFGWSGRVVRGRLRDRGWMDKDGMAETSGEVANRHWPSHGRGPDMGCIQLGSERASAKGPCRVSHGERLWAYRLLSGRCLVAALGKTASHRRPWIEIYSNAIYRPLGRFRVPIGPDRVEVGATKTCIRRLLIPWTQGVSNLGIFAALPPVFFTAHRPQGRSSQWQ